MIKKYKHAVFGTSEMADGNMSLNYSSAAASRRKYFRKVGLDGLPVVSAGLADGSRVRIVKNKRSQIIKGVDALITNEKDLILSITTADCLPVGLYDQDNGAVGIIHAGWRGLEKGIIGQTITAMIKEYGTKPRKLKMFVGPFIQKSHFEVKNDVFSKFKKYPEARMEINFKKYIDLGLVATIQAGEFGIAKGNINISKKCTHRLRHRYFSFRRDGVLRTMINFIVCRD